MNIKRLFTIILCLPLVAFFSCNKDDNGDDVGGINFEVDPNFTTNSQAVTYPDAVTIEYSTSGVKVVNPFSDKGVSVAVNKDHVLVKSTNPDTEVNYVLSGKTMDGSFKIYSDFRFKLIMNGVSVVSTYGPAMSIQSGKRVSIELVEKTNNRFADSDTYPAEGAEDMKAAFFSEGQLVFAGKGKLNVISRNRHSICSDDYIRFVEGTYIIKSTKDGVHANDYVEVQGGTFDFRSYSNAIEAEKGFVQIDAGTLKIESEDDAIHASYSGTDAAIIPYVSIYGGTIDIQTNEEGSEGIKSKGNLSISAGTITIRSQDDAIGAAKNIEISGGKIAAYSEKNDGIDANGTMAISGGTIITSGIGTEAGIDCEARNFAVTGGLLISTGGLTSIPTASNCTQPSVIFKGAAAKDQLIHIATTDGTEVLTYKFPRAYASLSLLTTSSALVEGANYTIYTGGSVSGGTEFKGLYTGATYTKGDVATTFTPESMVTTVIK